MIQADSVRPATWTGLSVEKLRWFLPIVAAIYIVTIQLPLLSPYRLVPADELQLVDAAYGVTQGNSIVPAGPLWSHIIPETEIFFAAYTPLYLYLQSLALKLFGMQPLTMGVLHLLLRLIAASLFYRFCRKLVPQPASAFLTAIWATLAVGPVGRYEDLAVIFLLASTIVVVDPREIKHRFIFVGLFIGLTFLTYPASLGMAIPLGLIVIFHSARQIRSVHALKELGGKILQTVLAASFVAATWLFWIVPFWHEFKVHFLEFSMPDAIAPSYIASLGDLIKYSVSGFLSSPFPFHYSLLPILSVFSLFLILNIKRKGFCIKNIVTFSLPLIVALLTARVRIHRTYNLIWFIVTILVLLPVLMRVIFREQGRFFDYRSTTCIAIASFAALIGLQLVAHLSLAVLDGVGFVAASVACDSNLHFELLEQIPPEEKVISNSSLVFYSIRERNPIYWPGGLSGETPGGIPFSSRYDDSFRWLVLAHPLSEDEIITAKETPGVKFRWDQETLAYFRMHYSLVGESDLIEACALNKGLSRFSGMKGTLYLYQRNLD